MKVLIDNWTTPPINESRNKQDNINTIIKIAFVYKKHIRRIHSGFFSFSEMWNGNFLFLLITVLIFAIPTTVTMDMTSIAKYDNQDVTTEYPTWVSSLNALSLYLHFKFD